MRMKNQIRIGVSSCLLGERLRYDGGHKHDPYITGELGRFFSLVPVCPEVGSGMMVPREAMRLEGDPAEPRLVTHDGRQDRTAELLKFAEQRVRELAGEGVGGFVFKNNSPSCGLFGVKVFREGALPGSGSGLFAAAVQRRFPNLPLEEEGRLKDAAVRENFVQRVFGYSRWGEFLRNGPEPGKLVEFHSRHKLVLMAHTPSLYREIGRLVAHGAGMKLDELLPRYRELFMKALGRHATVQKQVNVLQHSMGYFKKELTSAQKGELLAVIEEYREELVPLIVPVTLLKHYVEKHDQCYLKQQFYLYPPHAEVMLSNHA
jgi:uncharacterized protein YbgA (DUF1722 family)/uncharacterized protein YbbK (DUF523 family)